MSSPSSAPTSPNGDDYQYDLNDDECVTPSLERGGKIKEEAWGGWGSSDWQCIKVRGPTYLTSRVKIRARAPVFYLEKLELVEVSEAVFNIASRANSHVAKTRNARVEAMKKWQAERQSRPSSPASPNIDQDFKASCKDGAEKLRIFDPDFVFVVNFTVPGTPQYNLTAYFSRRMLDVQNKCFVQLEDQIVDNEKDDPAFNRAFQRFICGDNKIRDNKFKIIPVCVEGNWFVRKAVGNRPAILGNKLTQSYCNDEKLNYFEVDVDCGSSRVGATILSVSRTYAKNIIVDMTFLFESQSDEELPERIFGGVRMKYLDLVRAPPIDADEIREEEAREEREEKEREAIERQEKERLAALAAASSPVSSPSGFTPQDDEEDGI